jgi:hypothetical protein
MTDCRFDDILVIPIPTELWMTGLFEARSVHGILFAATFSSVRPD